MLDEKIKASFKNTETRPKDFVFDPVSGEEMKVQGTESKGLPSFESMLKEKMEQEKEKYDFKYIQRQFKSPSQLDQGAYLSER